MTGGNEVPKGIEPPIVEAPPPPSGLMARMRWAYWTIYRWFRPLTEKEISDRLKSWREEYSAPDPMIGLEPYSSGVGAERCCVMRIPGLGVRCSTEPSNDRECRALAWKYHEDAVAHFYGDRPCVNCQPLR